MDQNNASIIFQKNWKRYTIRKKYLVDKQYEDTIYCLFYLEQMKERYVVDSETIESLKQYNKDLERFMRIIRQKYELNQHNENVTNTYELSIYDPEE